MAVGGCDEYHAVGHEGLEEAAENHGVGDVSALELVEAENAALLSNVGRDKGNGVHVVAVLHLHLVQALVDILHEVVEVYPRLGLDILR